jgi:hypothetical protein
MIPSTISQVVLGDLQRVGREPQRLGADAARAASAMALPDMTAAREAKVPTAYGIRRVSPVVTWTSREARRARRRRSARRIVW